MHFRFFFTSAIAAGMALGASGCGDDGTGRDGPDRPYALSVTPAYPASGCVAMKQVSAAQYCHDVLGAWSAWAPSRDDGARDARVAAARTDLESAWSAAEQAARDAGSDCSDHALTASEATTQLDAAIAAIVDGAGRLDSESCAAEVMAAAGSACGDALLAEAQHLADPASDADGATLAGARTAAFEPFEASSGCLGGAETVRTATEGLVDGVVQSTIVAVNLDASQFTTISPTGTTSYLGKDLTPTCMDGSPYHFFVKRGTVNKVLMYYQGGGACWDDATCALPTCDSTVDPTGTDNPNNRTEGFADRTNPENPFRDWHQVFVSYCSCDIHFGDAAQDYPLHVEHRGYHNARYAEKWAREHFLAPEVVFVTGSSAGSYGALFNGALLHDTWPAAQFHVLGDAGNGVITTEFLNNELTHWNFIGNLPSTVPGVLESLTGGGGLVGYLEAVATHYPDTNWASYSTMYDGGAGGQTGFYNIMLNGSNPLAAVTWWEGSCAFGTQMRLQATTTYASVSSNYRYYIGTGSRHTMWGHDKVYADTTGGVPPIVDWIGAMLRSGPQGRDPAWTNVECQNCGLTLAGDPVPDPLAPPFALQGSDVVVVCP